MNERMKHQKIIERYISTFLKFFKLSIMMNWELGFSSDGHKCLQTAVQLIINFESIRKLINLAVIIIRLKVKTLYNIYNVLYWVQLKDHATIICKNEAPLAHSIIRNYHLFVREEIWIGLSHQFASCLRTLNKWLIRVSVSSQSTCCCPFQYYNSVRDQFSLILVLYPPNIHCNIA